MNAKNLYAILAKQNIRIFNIRIQDYGIRDKGMIWIHLDKTRDQFREDVRFFYKNKIVESVDFNLSAADKIQNAFISYLSDLGYIEIYDVVSDVFEGKVTSEKVRIIDDPDHDEQLDGFGHYGFESKNKEIYAQ